MKPTARVLVLLAHPDLRGSRINRRLMQAVQDLNNQFHSDTPLRLSIGIAVAAPDERLEAALHRADAQMYLQKRAYYGSLEHDRRQP